MPTIQKAIKLNGRGIHSGASVNVQIKPSETRGIFFVRTDMRGSKPIAARFDNVGDTKMRNTTVGDLSGAHVKTIEHLMAALFICGIDSAIVEIDGPETPILDGSAAGFIDAIMAVGVTRTPRRRRIIVRRPVTVFARNAQRMLPLGMRMRLWVMEKLTGRKNDGYVSLMPNDGASLEVTATLVYPEKIIGRQTYSYKYDGTQRSVNTFIKEIARARTFGKYSEWEYLKKHGMGRGADETNVIALNDAGDGTLNKTLWPDEFVRHKIIDAIGDMATSDAVIACKVESYKGSHALNNAVLKKLFSDKNNYDIVEE